MNRSEFEKLTDGIIGEAVFSLLKRKGPVNNKALIVELSNMETIESDPHRRAAIKSIITEIKTMLSERDKAERKKAISKNGTTGNVLPLFGARQQQGMKKIH
ncbi:hypothetical protein C3432_23805 [Citrobacter amalonaticus]|uniref:Uncharacterized protein n=1 Tax=Citrobacter amalonaticus TaxID=35703 RepID=A0A2S4S127_CITAM|nr:hypothetical protein [Citrobacter amalonaticus]POT55313.1 hypothetical protein C3432_23805 [Citrobacter amalonaticus]POT77080.1 hypothetical protein C3436_06495 [Citrobacter amalonaticus]POU67532.1 hypothetical protein C3430_00030 [Citrobacter amalonaticus]POV07137.1 hypothetical protein C3424_00040 [Citrobacter amalonaticus]